MITTLAQRRADFNKSLVEGELHDLVNVSFRVKRLRGKDLGLSIGSAINQAMKDIKKVNADNLKKYMSLY